MLVVIVVVVAVVAAVVIVTAATAAASAVNIAFKSPIPTQIYNLCSNRS